MRGCNTQGEILFYFFIRQREFPMGYSPVEKKENLFSGLQNTSHSLLFSSGGHTYIIVTPPHHTGLPSSTPNGPRPLGDADMFLLSDACGQAGTRYRGFSLQGAFLLQSQAIACLGLDPLNPRFWPRPPNWIRASPLIQVSHRQ